jgi:type VI secretion system protein ImpK
MSESKLNSENTQVNAAVDDYDSDTTRVHEGFVPDIAPTTSAVNKVQATVLNKPGKVIEANPVRTVTRLTGNSIDKIASPILMVISELRRPQQNIDLTKLRQSITLEINSFDVKAKSAGISDSKILLARYLLCAVVDEFVLDTPWGANSNWSEYSMLNTFHQDSAGGQKFFAITEKLMLDVVNYIDILELAYICLQLGYLGKYRIMQGGLNQLAVVKENIYRQITAQRGVPERTYTADVTVLDIPAVNQVKRVPLRKLSLITLGILSVIFLILFFILSHKANQIQQELRTLVVDNSVLEKAGVRQYNQPRNK